MAGSRREAELNVVMFTNTYLPHVGGVARSVSSLAGQLRRRRHRVLVVAPTFEGMDESEPDVLRVPALQRFNGSDFSVPVPSPVRLARALDAFAPQAVHSHHPFLLGESALRAGASRRLPVVFTHHTLYERYTHYVPGDSPRMQRVAIELASGYCDLCDAVIAPSETVRDLLVARGVRARIEVIPTGVDCKHFAGGDGERLRRSLDIPGEAFVVGHVGRLAAEKNLDFLTRACIGFLTRRPQARMLIAGAGPALAGLVRSFADAGLGDRLHLLGVLDHGELADVYRAMDVFAFASQSETQGMVLSEAMAAGVPVVAVDASGVREVMRDGVNGRLLGEEDAGSFVGALEWVADLDDDGRATLSAGVAETAERFSRERTSGRVLKLYESLLAARRAHRQVEGSRWQRALRFLGEEWRIVRNLASAAASPLRLPAGEPKAGTRR